MGVVLALSERPEWGGGGDASYFKGLLCVCG